MNLQIIIFEADSKIVVDAVNSSCLDNTEFRDIITRCRILLNRNASFAVKFSRRQANKAAHSLTVAQVTCSHACPNIWSHVPDFIVNILSEDCNRSSSS